MKVKYHIWVKILGCFIIFIAFLGGISVGGQIVEDYERNSQGLLILGMIMLFAAIIVFIILTSFTVELFEPHSTELKNEAIDTAIEERWKKIKEAVNKQ